MAKSIENSKNVVVDSTINTGGNVHLGDTIYLVNSLYSLVSPRDWISKVSPYLFDTTLPFFEVHQSLVDTFLRSPQQKVLLICGSGESGKTHLLRHVILGAISQSWEVYWAQAPITGSSPQSISTDQPVLVFRDDADWDEPEFIFSLLQLTENQPNVKLIMTTHISWEQSVQSVIEKIKDLSGKVSILKLNGWTDDQLVQMLRLAAKAPEVKYEKDIVRQFSNPYLLKYFGEALVGTPAISAEAISRNFAQKVGRVFEQSLQPELDASKVPAFITYLVFTQVNDSNLEYFANQIGTEPIVLQKIFLRLIAAETIKIRRGQYFITPEVIGEFYLANLLDTARDGIQSEVNLHSFAEKVIQITQFVNGTTKQKLGEYFKQYLIFLKGQNQNHSISIKKEHVAFAETILDMEILYRVSVATDAAFGLVSVYLLDYEQINSIHQATTYENQSRDLGYIGRFLESAIRINQKRSDYLILLEAYWKSGYKPQVYNYKRKNPIKQG
jgi:hypothetical protein